MSSEVNLTCQISGVALQSLKLSVRVVIIISLLVFGDHKKRNKTPPDRKVITLHVLLCCWSLLSVGGASSAHTRQSFSRIFTHLVFVMNPSLSLEGGQRLQAPICLTGEVDVPRIVLDKRQLSFVHQFTQGSIRNVVGVVQPPPTVAIGQSSSEAGGRILRQSFSSSNLDPRTLWKPAATPELDRSLIVFTRR